MSATRINLITALALALTPALAPDAAHGADRAAATAPAIAVACDGFANGAARLDRRCRAALDDVAETLRADPSAIVILTGHADNRDPEHFNTLEGLSRADNARRYLLDNQGIAYGRIVVETSGSSEPIADNATTSGRARNRRIEISIALPVR